MIGAQVAKSVLRISIMYYDDALHIIGLWRAKTHHFRLMIMWLRALDGGL